MLNFVIIYLYKTRNRSLRPKGPVYIDSHILLKEQFSQEELEFMSKQPNRYELSEGVKAMIK